jgi:polyphosphate kinase
VTLATPVADLDDPRLYINQELSWLKFNDRVLDEARNQSLPLLERVRFLSIYANNLDEFFMVRVSGLRDQAAGGVVEIAPDGMSPTQQLAAIRQALGDQLTTMQYLWHKDLVPRLADAGIRICMWRDLDSQQRESLRGFFAEEIFPVLTPLAFDPAHPFPHISNLSLNLAVVVHDPVQGERFARVKVPDTFPRLIPIVDGVMAAAPNISEIARGQFVWLEELVASNLDMLFPGLNVTASYAFRITRDADLDVKDIEASDLLNNIEEMVELRQWGSVVRMEIDESTPQRIVDVLTKNLDIHPDQVYTSREHLGLANLTELPQLDRPELKFTPYVPKLPAALGTKESIFDRIRSEPQLLYHPYDSFIPVVDFIREAANDPSVLAIKQTLYRVGANSPIVDALMEARQNGKQVAVLLEIQARFDEENNIAWARALEDEGVHVVYGVLGLKTHAKMCMVVRRESDGLQRYVHLGTGNYNTVTSRIYTDVSFFSNDPDIGADVSDLFNALTGYSRQNQFRKLLVAPGSLRRQILDRIKREVTRHKEHGDGYIAFKMNALVDKQCIKALYEASQAGVKVDLQVRGICCLLPGQPGVSDNIIVTSIVGRFLEHARIYYFRNGGDDEVLLGSADLMPRNLDRRVEVVFPLEDRHLRKMVIDDILKLHLRDNQKARRLTSDGTYEPVVADEPPVNSQEWLMAHWRSLPAGEAGGENP